MALTGACGVVVAASAAAKGSLEGAIKISEMLQQRNLQTHRLEDAYKAIADALLQLESADQCPTIPTTLTTQVEDRVERLQLLCGRVEGHGNLTDAFEYQTGGFAVELQEACDELHKAILKLIEAHETCSTLSELSDLGAESLDVSRVSLSAKLTAEQLRSSANKLQSLINKFNSDLDLLERRMAETSDPIGLDNRDMPVSTGPIAAGCMDDSKFEPVPRFPVDPPSPRSGCASFGSHRPPSSSPWTPSKVGSTTTQGIGHSSTGAGSSHENSEQFFDAEESDAYTIDEYDKFKKGLYHHAVQGFWTSVVGDFSVGKSFVINGLAGVQLPSGYQVTTNGISVVTCNVNGGTVTFCDSAGRNVAVPVKSKAESDFESAAKEQDFQLALLGQICPNQIFVVGKMTLQDQKALRQMSHMSKGTIFVLHNLRHVKNSSQFEIAIEDIKALLNASDDLEGRENRVSRSKGSKFTLDKGSGRARNGQILVSHAAQIFVQWDDEDTIEVFLMEMWKKQVSQGRITQSREANEAQQFTLSHWTNDQTAQSTNDYIQKFGVPKIFGQMEHSKVSQWHSFYWSATEEDTAGIEFNKWSGDRLKDAVVTMGLASTGPGFGNGRTTPPTHICQGLEAIASKWWKTEGGDPLLITAKKINIRPKEYPTLIGESNQFQDQETMKNTFDLAFAPEKFYQFILTSSKPGGDFRDFTKEGLLFKSQSKELKDIDSLDLRDDETYGWLLKIPGRAVFMPNQDNQLNQNNPNPACHVQQEDFLNVTFHNKDHAWSSFTRSFVDKDQEQEQESFQQKMFVVEAAGCEFANECRPSSEKVRHPLQSKEQKLGPLVKTVKCLTHERVSSLSIDTSFLKPKSQTSHDLVNVQKSTAGWTNVTKQSKETPVWSEDGTKLIFPVFFAPDNKRTEVAQVEGRLVVVVTSQGELVEPM